MSKKAISATDKALIDACRWNDKLNGIDNVIKEWATYTGCSDVQWSASLIPFLLSRFHELFIKIYGFQHFLRMLRDCYENAWRYTTDERCNQTSIEGFHYTHLEYWINKFRWIPNTDFVVIDIENVSKTKSETVLIGEEQEF